MLTRHLRFAAIAATFAALSSCSEPSGPPVPSDVEAYSAMTFSATAGLAVPIVVKPSVRVTTSRGAPVSGVTVTFAITGGDGSVVGTKIVVTNGDGIATVSSWYLGQVAGPNTMSATAGELPVVTFTATGVAGAPVKLALKTGSPVEVAASTVFTIAPRVEVQDVFSNMVSTSVAPVTATISAGGGSLLGTGTVAAVAGAATFSDFSIAGIVGPRTITFSSPGYTSATMHVTLKSGPAAQVTAHAGNAQLVAVGLAAPIDPAVRVTDASGNPVSGVSVLFAVTGGGGGVVDALQVSDASGIARVGTWNIGPTEGANTLSATAQGLPALLGNPVQFTATAITPTMFVTGVDVAALESGRYALILGTGFDATAANHTVTIDGVAALVTEATPTSLRVQVPQFPCRMLRTATVAVTLFGYTATMDHPLRSGRAVTLGVGESLILLPEDARCTDITQGAGTYYLTVSNTSAVYSTTGTPFQLRSGSSIWASVTSASATAAPLAGTRAPRRPRTRTPEEERARAMDRAHLTLLERDLQFLRENRGRWQRPARAALRAPGTAVAHAVGDLMVLRVRDVRVAGCDTYMPITARVAYIGEKAILVEDVSNPMAGTIDTTYAAIGAEYDAVMAPILEANFGNAMVNGMNPSGKLVMVFTRLFADYFTGLAGFVNPCDYFSPATFPASNAGEYFYAMAPTGPGTITTVGSPPRWAWSMRGTIIHEVKHIVSTAERFHGGVTFEESWLEETTARISEELYERARYGFAQGSNIGYGNAGNPVGPYCGVRLSCGQPRGIVRVFEELADQWYVAPHDYSPLGRINASDFSFYSTGWSLVRWTLDVNASAESSLLKAMTKEPSRTGMANFTYHTGMTLEQALPRWSLAMVTDDHPGVSVADWAIRQPSWDLRSVYAGYDLDFGEPWVDWPLNAFVDPVSTNQLFDRVLAVRPGTAAVIRLVVEPGVVHPLEFKAYGSAANAPPQLRYAILRVQ